MDASVAAAAGTTEHPVAAASRDFLREVMRICHRIVMTGALRGEWRRHRSNFAQTWLAAMVSRRKVVGVELGQSSPGLDSAIGDESYSRIERDAIRKDLHLVLAALQADRAVVSLDDRARELFQSLATRAPELSTVAWVNPCKSEEKPLQWLRAGAKNEAPRRLRLSRRQRRA